MASPYADTFSSVYHAGQPSIEVHRPQSGFSSDMAAPSHTQLPQLQTQRDPFRSRQQSIASGSSNWDASASDYSFHDKAPWANTPELSNCDSPNAVPSESPFAAMPDSAFGLSRPEDLALTLDLPKTLNLDDPEFSVMFQSAAEAPEAPRYGLPIHSRRPSDVGIYNQQNPAGQGNGGHSRNSSSASATQVPTTTGRARGQTQSSGGGDPEEDEDDGMAGNDAGGRRKRQRLSDGSTSSSAEKKPRLACPYQAYDTGLDCFHPGRRNPQGGCESIYRLRQHFKRRHRESHRCSNCWKSFEKAEEAARHPQEARCVAKPRPDAQGERFMTPAQAEKVDQGIGNRSEVEFWWDTFQTLIGDVEGMDRATVKQKYSPYYSNNNNNNNNNTNREPLNLTDFGVPNMMHQQQQQQQQQALMSPPQYTGYDMMPLDILGPPYNIMDGQSAVSQDTVVPHTPRDRLGSLPYADQYLVGPQQTYGWAPGAAGGISNNNGGDGGAGAHADQQQQQLAANNARVHIARIRDLVSETTAADPLPPSAHQRMAQISDILDRLEQSIP